MCLFFILKVWLALADQHIANIKVDWEKTKKFAFNEKSNPDDNKLGMQIVKVWASCVSQFLFNEQH